MKLNKENEVKRKEISLERITFEEVADAKINLIKKEIENPLKNFDKEWREWRKMKAMAQ